MEFDSLTLGLAQQRRLVRVNTIFLVQILALLQCNIPNPSSKRMNAYERVQHSLKRERCDRFPADMWATDETIKMLIKGVGAADEKSMYKALGVDKIIWVKADYSLCPAIPEGFSRSNEWGVLYRELGYESGVYDEVALAPLSKFESLVEYENYNWPDPDLFNYDGLKQKMEPELDHVAMLNFISLFEIYTAMRSYENALADLYIEKDMAAYALGRIAAVQLAYIDRALDAAGDLIDIVYFSDDMGMQDRQLFSTEVWDEMIAPHAERIIDLVHKRGKKVFYHTDGSAPEIVDRLVGMGIDILNPIQHICPGMERERLKKLYGKKVIFHGAVENQSVLPFGTPAEVRKETNECMRLLGKDGGYIVASCHNLQPNTPIDNIKAMYDAVQEAGDKYY